MSHLFKYQTIKLKEENTTNPKVTPRELQGDSKGNINQTVLNNPHLYEY